MDFKQPDTSPFALKWRVKCKHCSWKNLKKSFSATC